MPSLVDWQIRHLVAKDRMITNFVDRQVREHEGVGGIRVRVISYGLGPSGYDARLGYEFMEPLDGVLIDPKDVDENHYFSFRSKTSVRLKAGHTLLARTIEEWCMPRNVRATVTGKSTYARCDLIVNVTPMEPGWRGSLTVELINPSRHDIVLYPGEGILQVLFEEIATPQIAYDQRADGGKYQDQEGVTIARV